MHLCWYSLLCLCGLLPFMRILIDFTIPLWCIITLLSFSPPLSRHSPDNCCPHSPHAPHYITSHHIYHISSLLIVSQVTALAIADSDSRSPWRIVSGGSKGKIRIWNVTSSHQVGILCSCCRLCCTNTLDAFVDSAFSFIKNTHTGLVCTPFFITHHYQL
jgi:WD40 repeat protein